MNKVHREIIAKDLIASITKLLDAEVTYQIVTDSYGKTENRIIITHDRQTKEHS